MIIGKGNWRNSCSCAIFSTINLVVNLTLWGEKLTKLWHRSIISDIHFTFNQTGIRFVCVGQMGVSTCMIQSGGQEVINFNHFSRYHTLKLTVRALQYKKYIPAQTMVAFLTIFVIICMNVCIKLLIRWKYASIRRGSELSTKSKAPNTTVYYKNNVYMKFYIKMNSVFKIHSFDCFTLSTSFMKKSKMSSIKIMFWSLQKIFFLTRISSYADMNSSKAKTSSTLPPHKMWNNMFRPIKYS